MVEWQKVPKEHEALLHDIMRAFPEAEPRKMFGCPVYFLNGNMLAGARTLPPTERKRKTSSVNK